MSGNKQSDPKIWSFIDTHIDIGWINHGCIVLSDQVEVVWRQWLRTIPTTYSIQWDLRIKYEPREFIVGMLQMNSKIRRLLSAQTDNIL